MKLKEKKKFSLKRKADIKILENLYSSSKSNIAFTGVTPLYNEAKKIFSNIRILDIKIFLKSQDSYTLHKLTPKKFKSYRKVIVSRPKVIVSLDLIDMNRLSNYNDGYKYLILFIDVFSKKITVIPIKSKSKLDILKGLKQFFNIDDNMSYFRIYSDFEGGLYSKSVQDFLNRNRIITYSNSSKERKNSLAEISLKYLKRKIYMYLTHYSSNRYIDVLPDIVSGINNTTKSVFKNKFLTPQILHDIRRISFLKEMFKKMFYINKVSKKNIDHLYKINQFVRIPTTQRTQNVFFKSYEVVNTEEIFRIASVDDTTEPYLYKLKDLTGEDIKGSFYAEELIPAKLKNIYAVKILKEKFEKGKKKLYVTYLGWPSKYNEWIESKKIVH